ncbi:cobaltochelatase subunit CobN [Chelatococcus sp. GCM10030263]|uniref:cobaltochelatase subunit CobN n=1 Tax=Chelatococcus sp. GCM10030263 TaxID=3273387 RepID=UPI00361612C3
MHLLPVTTVGLDEAETPVDLAQSPAEMVVLSFTDTDLSALAVAYGLEQAHLPTLRLASLKHLRHPLSVDLYVEAVINHARVVLLRCLGGRDYLAYGLDQIAASCCRRGALLTALSGDDRPDPRLEELSTVPGETYAGLDGYFRAGGVDNLRQALRLMANGLGRALAVRPLQPVPAAGVASLANEEGTTAAFPSPLVGEGREGGDAPSQARDVHGLVPSPRLRGEGQGEGGVQQENQRPSPGRLAADLSPRAGRGGAPVALILFYRSVHLAGDTAPIDALGEALAARGLMPLPVYVTSLKDEAAIAVVEDLIARHRPTIILNTTAFSALREDGTSVLDRADCPVLQVVLAGARREAWEASPRGLGPADVAMNIALPEIDGRIATTAISFKAETERDPALEFAHIRHQADPDQIALVADRAAGWMKLARKPPAERRLILVIADYPSRGGRTGYAVGLDTARSTAGILKLLGEAGYAVETVDATAVLPQLEAGRERAQLSLASYEKWLAGTSTPFREAVIGAWGQPQDDPAFNDGFSFPVLRAGHVVIALQPERGRTAERKASYHDPALPPRHGYCAFYAWLAQTEVLDAIVHLGTHGTLEWLPGKTVALSPACAPQVLTGGLPVIYPFIVNNPGEAAVAKRRIGAVTIGHLTPPIMEAGLDGPAAELEALIDEYAAADGLDGKRQLLLRAAIVEKARASGLAAECGAEAADDEALITALDAWLCDLKEFAIRDGLHVFGEAPLAEAAAAMAAMAGEAWAEAALRLAAAPGAERQALLAALDGRFVPPGPAGAPTRGRLDVLPTGRNLTGLDPRSIPTRTALVVGERAAAEVLRRYLQDNGEWPRALVMDLWASATLRTGGDDLAEALVLMGARPTWDHASSRVTGVAIVPGPKLDRPRIDVTLRVSGLFRDAFAAQITLFDQAVQAIAALDEGDDVNPLAAARRRRASLDRIFSGAPGTYGAGVSGTVLDGEWESRAGLGEAYLAAGAYALQADGGARPAAAAFRARVQAADALVHAQDDRERDALDTEDVADFVGGFAAAAAALGASPALIHLDTSRPEAPRARLMGEEIARIVRGRLANPRWIEGQLRHGYRGAAELAQGVDALYAFAATTDVVTSRQFEAVFDAYLGDEAVWSRVMAVNPSAGKAMAARFSEALRRGLWQPRRNSVFARLANALGEPAEAAE